MPRYRLRDAAVLVGAVVIGAAAGFNGGWWAAVPPKANVDTANKLTASNVDTRPAPAAPPPVRQAMPDTGWATDPRTVRVIRPAEQTNETSANGQEKATRVPPQPLDDVRVPVSPPPTETTRMAPAPAEQAETASVAPVSSPPKPATVLTTEVKAQASVNDAELPRTTVRSESRRSDAKKKSQKAASQQKPTVQKAKRKDQRPQEVESDETETAERESREMVYERSESRRGYTRIPASDAYARGRVKNERERDRSPREPEYEDRREGFGLFDMFVR
jgi:hypothetical protein